MMNRVVFFLSMLLAAGTLMSACSSTDSASDVVTGEICSCDPEAECTGYSPECQEPVACETDAECDDGNPCTEGVCNSIGECEFSLTGAEGCCTVDMDCDDENACTLDQCNPITGQCGFDVPDAACCAMDAHCDDLNPCTTDKCEEGACVHTDLLDCCQANGDCNDLNPCTNDICLKGTGSCVNPFDSSIAGCECGGTGDCEDGNECTVESCLSSQCHYDLFLNANGIPSPGCCDENEDCDDGDATTVDQCIHFVCISQHVKPCMVDTQCNDGNLCTVDSCQDGYCVVEGNVDPTCCESDAACDDMSECTVDTCVDNVCVNEYNAGQAGCCETAAECNDNVSCTTDECVNNKCVWTPMGEGCCHDATDCPQATKPCQEAKCKQGQCVFESATNCCTVNSDCNDGDPCTTDQCEVGQCFYWDVENCCALDSDCDDENPCTVDKCNNGVCAAPTMLPNCCVNAGQCNDSDPCTTDKCENNACVFEPKADCCHYDYECEDEKEIDCQVPHCQNGNCIMDFGPNCCIEDDDCDDGFPICTVDTCVDNGCVFTLADEPGCCMVDEDCTSVDPCVAATCKSNHTCDYMPIPDCCKDDAACDDGDDVCTVDTCVNNVCSYELTFEANCCLSNDDCDTDDICLKALCNVGQHQCYSEEIPNCCETDEECTDGEDICTLDLCQNNQCVHDYTGADGCCTMDSQCTNADACLAGTCVVADGTCVFEAIPGCCHNDEECNDGDDVCTTDTCVDNFCVYEGTGAAGCCEEFTWGQNFDDGADGGFVIDNAFSMSELGGDMMIDMLLSMLGITDISLGWQVSNQCGSHSTAYSLYYGTPPIGGGMLGDSCMYGLDFSGIFGGLTPSPTPPPASPIPGLEIPTDFPNAGTALSAEMILPADQGHHLDFWLLCDISSSDTEDLFTIEVLEGDIATQVWSKMDLAGDDYGIWTPISIDLADFSGSTIKVQFSFDTMGGSGAGGIGILVDDITVTADCNAD